MAGILEGVLEGELFGVDGGEVAGGGVCGDGGGGRGRGACGEGSGEGVFEDPWAEDVSEVVDRWVQIC